MFLNSTSSHICIVSDITERIGYDSRWIGSDGLVKSVNMPQTLPQWACGGRGSAATEWNTRGGRRFPRLGGRQQSATAAICSSNINGNNLQQQEQQQHKQTATRRLRLFGTFNGSCRCLFWCNEIKQQKSFYRSVLPSFSPSDDDDIVCLVCLFACQFVGLFLFASSCDLQLATLQLHENKRFSKCLAGRKEQHLA